MRERWSSRSRTDPGRRAVDCAARADNDDRLAGEPKRPCGGPPGLEGLGDGPEESKWSTVRLVRSEWEMTHHLT